LRECLASGELDHDSCEAAVSTEGANHDIIKKIHHSGGWT